jgi:hypothetical protein
MPDEFSRVITWIGSFTAIQWHEDPAVSDGGQDYPEKVLREPRRNLRVWIEDGSGDQENDRYGSWPLANIRMANALKLKGYDFRFSFGVGPHSPKEGGAEFAEEMTWLWGGLRSGEDRGNVCAGSGGGEEAAFPGVDRKSVNPPRVGEEANRFEKRSCCLVAR